MLSETEAEASGQLEHQESQRHVIQVIGGDEAKARGKLPAYSRVVFTREVTFTCIVCQQTVTQQRYPGHTPLYCSDECKGEREREETRERVARHREKKKQQAKSNASSQEGVPSEGHEIRVHGPRH